MNSWSTTPPSQPPDADASTAATGSPHRPLRDARPATAAGTGAPAERSDARAKPAPAAKPRPPRQPGKTARRRPAATAPAPAEGDEKAGAARRRGRRRQEHERLAGGADRHQRAGHPAKLMIDNRVVINNHLKRTRGGKISFTHLIGYAIVQAVKKFPNMNRHFAEVDGKPNAVTPAHTNLGPGDRPAGQGRQPPARGRRHQALRDNGVSASSSPPTRTSSRRARDGKLTAEDFARRHHLADQPGHHRHRALGAAARCAARARSSASAPWSTRPSSRAPARSASPRLGVGKLITLTSTYDHRIIQGAESGDFLRTIHQLLLDDDFFDEIFRELGIPYEPVRWRTDNPTRSTDKNARVIELIAAYRNRGHLMADIDPLRLDKTRFRSHPDLDVQHPRADAVGPGPRVQGRRASPAPSTRSCATCCRAAARRLLPARRRGVHPHPGTRAAEVAAGTRRGQARASRRSPSRSTSCPS